MKKTLCLDFDGVISSYKEGWHGADFIPDEPVDGAIEFLRWAIDEYEVVIFSSRSHQDGGIQAMRNWLRYWSLKKLELEEANTLYNRLLNNDKSFPKYKPAAYLTIDDRAWTFKGVFPSKEEIDNFKPWNKQ